jgi:hypothetical protein
VEILIEAVKILRLLEMKEALLEALPQKLLKATVSFFVSVRLSAWNKSAPTGRIFMKFDI